MKDFLKYSLLLLFMPLFSFFSKAQDSTLSALLTKKQGCVQIPYYVSTYGKLKPNTFYMPALAIGYGVIAQQKNGLNQFDRDIKNAVVPHDRTRKLPIDNYLQFAPGVITLGMTAAGVKGNQNLRDAAVTYALTNIILNAAVVPLKHYAHRLRPDSSSHTSFPSGHTTEAFANAEFMRMQYGKKYPWLAVAGYAKASTTGFLRMYNNKHWFSDVVAGAAIGFCSARLAGWVYTRWQHKSFSCKVRSHGKVTTIVPSF